MMSPTVKGYLCGIISAVSYGMNPLGALFLYEDGLRPPSVLFYRFSFAAVMIAVIMAVQRKSFGVNRHELLVLLSLGLLFSVSSLTYYMSFQYMDAGIACTLLFFYPVMVAVLMVAFFGEKLKISTVLAIVMALAGILLLYRGDGDATLSGLGLLFIIISGLTYAVYIIVVNQSSIRMSSLKLTLYVLIICAISLAVFSYSSGAPLQALPTPRSWICAIGLALVPSVISLVTMAMAVQLIGSTPTAIMGALEPLTAVVIGVTVFGEILTPRLSLGILLILGAVMIIIVGKKVSPRVIMSSISHFGGKITKHWRWK